jgi:hypothetical protein
VSNKKPIEPTADVVIADDFTLPLIATHLASTLQLIVSAEAQWPGLVSLITTERTGNLGKLIALLDPSLRALFDALTPVQGEAPTTTASKKKLASVFNTALGDQDQGKDPAVFEVDLLVRRLTRIEASQKIVDALDALRKRFADDMLNTGAMVVEPGLKALEVARGIADSNAEFRSLMAPVTNSLGDMTKAARLAQAEARAEAKAQKAAAKTADPGPKTATSTDGKP